MQTHSFRLKKTKDHYFAAGSATSFATNTPWPKIRFIHFGLSDKAYLPFAFISQAGAKFDENRVDRPDRDSSQSGSVGSQKIERKIANNLTKYLLCNSGTLIVSVFVSNFRGLTPMC